MSATLKPEQSQDPPRRNVIIVDLGEPDDSPFLRIVSLIRGHANMQFAKAHKENQRKQPMPATLNRQLLDQARELLNPEGTPVHPKRGRPPKYPVGGDGKAADQAQRHRDRMAQRSRENTAADQEIGELPPVKNPERKAACAESLEKFCKLYLPATFYMPFSDMHREVIAKTEHSIRHGGLHAMALPRASGKTACARAAALWAILYGYTRYVYFIGANADKAKKNLKAIKGFVSSPELLEDFPEAIYPLLKLRGEPRRCTGQTYRGKPTLTQWSNTAVVFPAIEGSKASGGVFNVDGITSGFRGADFTHPGGEMLRPSTVVIDDPQTDRSSKSDSMCEEREVLIAGAVLGLAGPDKKISALMPCTVIRPGDLSDRMLNVKLHPEWNGSRYGLVKAFPEDMELWAAYKEKLVSFNPDVAGDNSRAERDAKQFYLDNYDDMRRGAVLTWPERFTPDCTDALEFAMRLKFRDERAFMAEYQNNPIPPKTEESSLLKPHQIAEKQSGSPRFHVPVTATRLTAGIDVQKDALYYVVSAWEENFTGYIIDYGTFPEQRGTYFRHSEIQNTIAKAASAAGIHGEEAQLRAALTALTTHLCERQWTKGLNGSIRVSRALIDANWGQSTDIVYKFITESRIGAVLTPSHGRGIGAKNSPMNVWKRDTNRERFGLNWLESTSEIRAIAKVIVDTNFWKTFFHHRVSAPPGSPGCLSLFKADPAVHRMFCDHLVSEYPTAVTANGRTVDEWMQKANTDNHYFDCAVLSAVAASMQGVSLIEHRSTAKQEPKWVSFAEQYARAKAGR